jgi:hypothetical protein
MYRKIKQLQAQMQINDTDSLDEIFKDKKLDEDAKSDDSFLN